MVSLIIVGILALLKCSIPVRHVLPCSSDQWCPAKEIWHLRMWGVWCWCQPLVSPGIVHPVAQWLPGSRTCLLLFRHCIVGARVIGCGIQTPPALHAFIFHFVRYFPLWSSFFTWNVLFRPKESSGRRESLGPPTSNQTFHSFTCLKQNSRPKSVWKCPSSGKKLSQGSRTGAQSLKPSLR